MLNAMAGWGPVAQISWGSECIKVQGSVWDVFNQVGPIVLLIWAGFLAVKLVKQLLVNHATTGLYWTAGDDSWGDERTDLFLGKD